MNTGSTSLAPYGSGTFIQTGGLHNTQSVIFGIPGGGSGTYLLRGGTLSIAGLGVGAYGSFIHSGGTLLIDGTVSTGGTVHFASSAQWTPGSQFISRGGVATFLGDTGGRNARNVAFTTAASLYGYSPPARIWLHSSQHLSSLSVLDGRVVLEPGGDKVLSVGSLQVGGTIDLNDNGLLWDYPDGQPSPVGIVRNLIIAARFGGGGAWRGPGITSSMADEQTWGLGYWDKRQLHAPRPPIFALEPSRQEQVLATRTYYGDADGDGRVDLDDLEVLAINWQRSGFWWDGDFNYDAVVNIADLYLLARNWHAGTDQPALDEALAQLGLPRVEVPEASSVFWLALMAGLARRANRQYNRRRHGKDAAR